MLPPFFISVQKSLNRSDVFERATQKAAHSFSLVNTTTQQQRPVTCSIPSHGVGVSQNGDAATCTLW